MMKNFASFTLSGKFPAFTVVFGFLLFALVFPLSAVISGTAIVLITLHAGPKNSFSIVLACTIALSLMSAVLIGNASLGAATGVAQLLPSFILAVIFYSTRSLSLSLQAASLLGALAFILVSAAFPDSAQFWQQSLSSILAPVLETGGYNAEQSAVIIAQTAKFMTGLLIASIVLVHSCILLFGYKLKCIVDDNQQFKRDFQSIRLGKVLAALAVAVAIWAFLAQSAFAAQLCGILTILFFLQGMAVIHTTSGTMTKGKLWLIIAYILVIFVPQVILAVILLGIFETFFKIRERVK
ncbi:MAG: hypothetical protein R8G33_06770 [Gammaproteobacteria bacterium]|nr:hypothetical protein [Gammaproteobacteria bacterium]